ncbi:hypothetical protein MauCBS54593_001085 [Microsporum audouinii]
MSDEWTSDLVEGEESEESEEDTVETVEIKGAIDKALRSIDTNGDFAYFHSINRSLNPSLHINGLGRVVDLPLSPEDAKAVVDLCHRSPFGKGAETLVDTSVRKCWELNVADFDLKAPGWGNYMKKVIADVSKGLGIAHQADSIRADPYKLLLYEEGAFFLSHQDSPKADGMFGTLVVCLPTKHEGGEIILKHDDKSLVFKTSTTSRAGFSYAAWYSDVFHEVQPITAGYRLVLTYNLIHEGSSNVPKAPTSKTTPLVNALKLWKSRVEADGPDLLLYKLSHMYTDSSLSFQRMKGKDHQRMAELQAACQELGFRLYLGNVERTVTGSCDEYPNTEGYYEIEELINDITSMKKVVDLQGNVVSTKIPVKNIEYIQSRVLRGAPTDEDFSGYTGNEGTSVAHFYRNTAAVIVPEILDIHFRFRGMRPECEEELSAWLKNLLPLIENPEDSKSREEFTQLAKLTLHHNEAYYKIKAASKDSWLRPSEFRNKFSDPILSILARGLHKIGDLKLFDNSIQLHSTFIDPDVYPCIAETLADREYPAVKKFLDNIVRKAEGEPIKQSTAVDDLVSACLALPDDKRPAEWDDLLNWKKAKLLSILPKFRGGDKAEGDPIVRIIELYPAIDKLKETLKLRKQVAGCGVVASYLSVLGDSFLKGKLVLEGFSSFYQSAITDLMEDFDLGQGTIDKRVPYSGPVRVCLELDRSAVDSHDLIKIYRNCQSLDISTSILHVGILRAVRNCKTLNLAFTEILVPFLRYIVLNPQIPPDREDRSPEASFVLRLILEYLLIFVKPRSQATSSWARPINSACSCGDCRELNAFLTSSVQESLELKISSGRRAHIHQKLNNDPTISHETRRVGSPFTLVITKLGNPATIWKRRAVDAVKNINNIGSASEVEALVGSSAYKSLMALDIVIKGGSVDDYVGSADTSGRKRSATSELNPGEGPSRRQFEVIDLTK